MSMDNDRNKSASALSRFGAADRETVMTFGVSTPVVLRITVCDGNVVSVLPKAGEEERAMQCLMRLHPKRGRGEVAITFSQPPELTKVMRALGIKPEMLKAEELPAAGRFTGNALVRDGLAGSGRSPIGEKRGRS